jgi:hypothetical protein
MDTFRALAKPEGLKFTPLFAQPMDGEARAARIEREVQTIRNDIDTLVPSMVRLVAIEKDMKELVAQLKTLTGDAPPVEAAEMLPVEQNEIGAGQTTAQAEAQDAQKELQAALQEETAKQQNKIPGEDVARGTEPAVPAQAVQAGATAAQKSLPVTPEAAPKGLPPEGAASPSSPPPPPAPAPVVTPAPAATAPASGAALDVRFGDHPDKTRIVIDLSGKANVKSTLENDGQRLVIDLGGAVWSGKKSSGANVSQLVSGWRVESGKLYVDLLGPATIRAQELLPAGEGGGHRAVIDLHSTALHN